MKSNFSEIYKPWQIAVFICIVGVILSTTTGYFLEGKIIFRQIYMPVIIGGPVSYFFYRSIWKYKNLLNKINIDLESGKYIPPPQFTAKLEYKGIVICRHIDM